MKNPRGVLLDRRKVRAARMEKNLSREDVSGGQPTLAISTIQAAERGEKWVEAWYCAPEVASPNIDVRADLYSWGRILVHAAVGELPERGTEAEALAAVKLPSRVREIVHACVAQPCNDRPADMAQVLKALRSWR